MSGKSGRRTGDSKAGGDGDAAWCMNGQRPGWCS